MIEVEVSEERARLSKEARLKKAQAQALSATQGLDGTWKDASTMSTAVNAVERYVDALRSMGSDEYAEDLANAEEFLQSLQTAKEGYATATNSKEFDWLTNRSLYANNAKGKTYDELFTEMSVSESPTAVEDFDTYLLSGAKFSTEEDYRRAEAYLNKNQQSLVEKYSDMYSRYFGGNLSKNINSLTDMYRENAAKAKLEQEATNLENEAANLNLAVNTGKANFAGTFADTAARIIEGLKTIDLGRFFVPGAKATYEGLETWLPGVENTANFLSVANEKEIETYNKFIAAGQKDKAKAYVKALSDRINKRVAEEEFAKYSQTAVLEIMGAFNNVGVESFFDGVVGAVTKKDYYLPSDSDYLQGMINEDLADNGPYLNFFGKSLGQMASGMAVSGGNMLPSIGVSFIPVVGQVLSPVMMGLSSGGKAYMEAKNSGWEDWKARTYGMLIGGAEAGLSVLLGGLGKQGGALAKKVSAKMIKRFSDAMEKPIRRFLLNTSTKMGGEAVEEFLQGWIDPILKLAINQENDFDNVWAEAFEGAISGALLAVFMDGGNAVMSTRAEQVDINSGREFRQSGGDVPALIAEMSNSKNKDAAKIAKGAIDGDLTNLEIGQLLRAKTNEPFMIIHDKDVKNAVKRAQKAFEGDNLQELQERFAKLSDEYTGKEAEAVATVWAMKVIDLSQKAQRKALKEYKGEVQATSQSEAVEAKVAETLGMSYRVINDPSENAPRGWYDSSTNEIVVNKAVGATAMEIVFKHEMTHSVENLANYATFANSVFESKAFTSWLSKNNSKDLAEQRTKLIEERIQRGDTNFTAENITQTELDNLADQEIIADFVGEMLFTDTAGLKKLVKNMQATEKKTFGQWLRNIIESLKAKFSGNTEIENEISKFEKEFADLLSEHKQEVAKKSKAKPQTNESNAETEAETETKTDETTEEDATPAKETEEKAQEEVKEKAQEENKPQKIVTKKKFDMSEPVERTENMYVVSNYTIPQFIKALSEGGIAMESYAVLAGTFTKFGEISILYERHTIERSARLYNMDAWTAQQGFLKPKPKFRRINFRRFAKSIKEVAGDVTNITEEQLKQQLNKKMGDIFAFANTEWLMLLYASETNMLERLTEKTDQHRMAEEIKDILDEDSEFRAYRIWMREKSDKIMEKTRNAKEEEIFEIMKTKEPTTKEFKLNAHKLVVPPRLFDSVEEMRASRDKLATEEQAIAAEKALHKEFLTFAEELAAKTGQSIKEIYKIISKAFSFDAKTSKILQVFKEAEIEMSTADIKKLKELFEKADNLPVWYFEAKASEVVSITEAVAVIVPSDFLYKKNAEGLELLKKLGIKYEVYKKGDNAQRAEIANSYDVRFSYGSGAPSAMEQARRKYQYKAMETDKKQYREMLTKWGKISPAEIDELFGTIDTALRRIKKNLEALDYAWDLDVDDRAFKPVKPNSDKLYKVSVDFSTLCRKRILQQIVQIQLEQALQTPLTREERAEIRQELIKLRDEGLAIEVACGLCYVEAARLKSPKQIEKFLNTREAVLIEFFATKSGGDIKTKVEEAEAKVRKELGVDSKAKLKTLDKKVAQKIRDAKKEAKKAYQPTAEEQKLIEVAKKLTITDFTSPEGLTTLAKKYPLLYDAYTSYVRNATKSKGIEADTWWRAGDSKEISDNLISKMNLENGLRTRSWSDFQVIHLLDYIAATIELSTRNAKEQAYTKVPDFVELMGNTNLMINLSLIPLAIKGDMLTFDSNEGMDYQRALELREKYHATAGTIAIGATTSHIRKLLADIYIDYVIPYHSSGLPAALRKIMSIPNWDNFEKQQNESKLNRKEAEKNAEKLGVKLLSESDENYHKAPSFSEWFDIKKAKEFADSENASPSDAKKAEAYGVMYGGYMAMQSAAQDYIELCAERGLAPKFSELTSEDNYWKLLIDRKMVDNVTGDVIDQKTLMPNFDSNTIKRILDEEVERYGHVKQDQETATRYVVNKFLSSKGLTPTYVENTLKPVINGITDVSIIGSNLTQVPKNAKKSYGSDVNKTHKADANADAEYEILTRLQNGDISVEEVQKFLHNERQTPEKELSNITKITEEDVNTTPERARKKGKSTGNAYSAFAESIEESKWTSDELKEEAKSASFIQKYQSVTNRGTLEAAVKELDEGGAMYVRKWFTIPAQRSSLIDEAVGFVLLERYRAAGDVEGQVAVAEKMREFATASGQRVQIFSVLGRLTPEAMLKYAQKELDQAREAAIKEKSAKWVEKYADRFNLTSEDAEFISRRARQAANLPEGSRAKDIVMAEIAARIQSKLPAESGQGIKAIQRVSMLLNAKTNARNIAGNAISTPLFMLSDVFGAGIDRFSAKKAQKAGFDAQRTQGAMPSAKGVKDALTGLKKGAVYTYDDWRRRINTRNSEANRWKEGGGKAFDENVNNKVLRAAAKAFNEMDRLTSALLEMGDRPFYEMWFAHSLNQQLKLNNVTEPTADMIEIATNEALQRTWQDKNKMTESVSLIKNGLNTINLQLFGPRFANYGLGDALIKFTKTPANLAKAIIEFSPLGLVKAVAYDATVFSQALKKGNYDVRLQHNLAQSIGKGIAGTLFQATVYALVAMGAIVLTGQNDEDKDVRAFEQYVAGMPAYSIKTRSGKYVTYDWAMPVGAFFAAVADFNKTKQEEPDSPYYKQIYNALSALGDIFLQQSFLYSLQEFFNSDEDLVSRLVSAAFAEPAVFVPQLISQFADATDPYRRSTYSSDPLENAWNKVLVKIPGARQTLEPARTVTGDLAKNPRHNIYRAFFSPGNVNSRIDSDAVDEVYRLYKATGEKSVILPKADGSATIKGISYTYSIAEKEKIQEVMGTTAVDIIEEAMRDSRYRKLSDEQKTEFVTKVYAYAKAKAKGSVVYPYDALEAVYGKSISKVKYDNLSDRSKAALSSEYFLDNYSKVKKGKEADYFLNKVID